MDFTHLEDFFVDIGGQFITSSFDMKERMPNIKAYVFDWDGVFNDGRKDKEGSSFFSEVDSLGVNMLRFGHYLTQNQLPQTAIITGECNPAAVQWSEREHLHNLYSNVKEKGKAFLHFCESKQLRSEEVCYIYDDVLDIPVAQKAGLRMAVGRLANPLLLHYVQENHLADYISAAQGNEHAVREFSELLLALQGQHFEVIDQRAENSEKYQQYLSQRQQVVPQKWNFDGKNFVTDK